MTTSPPRRRRSTPAVLPILALLAASFAGVLAQSAPASARDAGPYPAATLFRPDGTVVSAPATVTLGSIGTAAFAVGTDGGIWWSTQANPWSPLGAPPGGLKGDPAVVSWGPGRIDLFVEGKDKKLWQQWSECSGCQWSGWAQPFLDGTLASPPAVTSWGPGRIDVIVQGTDAKLYQRDWDTKAWSGGWAVIGAPSIKATTGEKPAVTTWEPGRLDAFVRGVDNKLWQAFMLNGVWTGWFQPPGTQAGTLNSAPGAETWNGGAFDGQKRLTVFVQGTDSHLYQATFDGGWNPWMVAGSPQNVFLGAPEVATTLADQPVVLVRGTDGRVYEYSPTSQLAQNIPAAAAFAASRSGVAAFTVIDTATQSIFSNGAADTQIRTASVVKVPIAMALLDLANRQHRGLTASESNLLHLMITQSDNNAATALFNEVGGSATIVGLMRNLGATNTAPWAPSPGAWGFTLSTSHDLAVVLASLAEGVLGPNATAIILDEMHQVIPSQSWGIGAALPGSAIKNGWFPDPGDWRVNCLGIISGTRFALAVMTQYPIGLGQGYGEFTCQGIAADLFPAMAAVSLPHAALGPQAHSALPSPPVPAISGIGMTVDGG